MVEKGSRRSSRLAVSFYAGRQALCELFWQSQQFAEALLVRRIMSLWNIRISVDGRASWSWNGGTELGACASARQTLMSTDVPFSRCVQLRADQLWKRQPRSVTRHDGDLATQNTSYKKRYSCTVHWGVKRWESSIIATLFHLVRVVRAVHPPAAVVAKAVGTFVSNRCVLLYDSASFLR